MKKALSLLFVLIIALSSSSVSADSSVVEKVDVYVNGARPASWITAVVSDGAVYLPAIATARIFGIDVNVIDYYSSAATVLVQGESSGYFFNNNYYSIINGKAVDLSHPTILVNAILYLPCDVFNTLFNIESEFTESDGVKTLYLKSAPPSPPADEKTLNIENDINSKNITSSTDYLIWVSKKDYSVRLFKKQGSKWQLQKEYPCAIGKPSSPTCEGTFKYYEKITAWKYDNYYVGPVMRFNHGYALHSTLVRYDGTPYDDRVGVKISAGCIRLHPADIKYLWDNVPLQTTVYVTA